ncbi:MAG: polysaccharide biosynthesis C-terminal domain-containing protein, partial [Clostridia bacterium]|nr:polysaccharide biosynthesis C-terminal domain-containing protein [Clostridia bacterium]
VMEAVFGQRVEEGVLLLLAASAVFAAFQSVASGILVGYGRQRAAMVYNLLGGALHLGMMWTLTPHIGIWGTLFGSLGGNLLPTVLSFLRLREGFPFRKALLRPAGIALCSFFPGRAVWLMLGKGAVGAALSLCVSVGIYLLLVFCSGYDPKRYLKTLIPKEKHG